MFRLFFLSRILVGLIVLVMIFCNIEIVFVVEKGFVEYIKVVMEVIDDVILVGVKEGLKDWFFYGLNYLENCFS